jgi:predicted  nucleic acid-binding Zn-ribbon protein
MQEQILKLSEQIKKLQKEIMDLKTNLNRVENEKQEEIGRAEKARIQYESKIKDLESQIEMLKNSSGDLVSQLQ